MSGHVETKSSEEAQNQSSHVATSLDKARFTLSVEEAAELFAKADLPRSKRSIARWCQQGVLEYIRVDTEKNFKFLIDPVSVERRITELKQARLVTKNDEDISSHVETEEKNIENVSGHVETNKISSPDMSRQYAEVTNRETETRVEVIYLDERERELLERMLADREAQIISLTRDKEDFRDQIKSEQEMRKREQEMHMDQIKLLAASDRETKGVTKTIANLISNIWPGAKGSASGEQPMALTTVIHDIDDELGGDEKE